MPEYLTAVASIAGPGLIAAALIAMFGNVTNPQSRRRWLQLSVASSFAAALVAFGLDATRLVPVSGSWLLRDSLACGVFSGVIAAVMAASIGQALWRGTSTLHGTLIGILLASVLAAVTPLLVLLVHCSSGDCL